MILCCSPYDRVVERPFFIIYSDSSLQYVHFQSKHHFDSYSFKTNIYMLTKSQHIFSFYTLQWSYTEHSDSTVFPVRTPSAVVRTFLPNSVIVVLCSVPSRKYTGHYHKCSSQYVLSFMENNTQ